MKKKILISPVHYFFDDTRGSELGWAYTLFTRLSYGTRSITGISYHVSAKKVNEKLIYKKAIDHPYHYTLLELFIFIFFYTQRGLRVIIKNRINVLHHMLPFYIGKSFNPLFFLTPKKVVKIIGPIQSQTVTDGSDAMYRQSLLSKVLTLLLRPVYQSLSMSTLRRANKIIVINEYTRKYLAKRGISNDRIVVIPPGIDTRKFSYSKKKPMKTIRLVNINYLTKRKNVETLIKAIKIISSKHSNIKLDIIGDGPEIETLKSLAGNLGIQKIVTFHGYVSHNEIQKHYQAAHIFVNVSLSEAFATTSLEAMASGLAVVSTHVGGYSDVITNNETGIFVEKENPQDLAHKISTLIEGKNTIIDLGRKAHKHVTKYYDWDAAIIPQYKNVYKTV